MDSAALSLYTLNLLSADQCRFNRRIMSLEAVSCACGAANSSCLDAIPTLPSASGFVCSTAQRFAAPPLSFTFYSADLRGCTSVTMFHVSPLNFGSLAPPQALSTYWTKPSHVRILTCRFVTPYVTLSHHTVTSAQMSRPHRHQEFAGLTFGNELGAAVGQVVGTGFLLNSSSSLAQFCASHLTPILARESTTLRQPPDTHSAAWVCFPTPNFTERSTFSVPDLAIRYVYTELSL